MEPWLILFKNLIKQLGELSSFQELTCTHPVLVENTQLALANLNARLRFCCGVELVYFFPQELKESFLKKTNWKLAALHWQHRKCWIGKYSHGKRENFHLILPLTFLWGVKKDAKSFWLKISTWCLTNINSRISHQIF